MKAQLSTILALAAVVGLATAIPPVSPPRPQSTTSAEPCPTLCIDGIDDCGRGWGGCYDICTGIKPVMPRCTPSTITTVKVTPTITAKPTSTCVPRTKCIDMVNECGKKWGGCFNTCLGDPKTIFTKPPCPTSTTTRH